MGNGNAHLGRRPSRARLTALATGAFAASALVACSLITSVDGLTGGALDDASSRDGGALDAGGDALVSSETGADGATEAATTCPPYVLPATCEAKYLTDDKNCCIAGRDCHGGGCVAGKCQPVKVVSDATGDARGIAVSNDKLLWATGCTAVVRRVGTDGTGNTPLPTGQYCTPTVAVSGASVFWIEFNGPNLMGTLIDGTGEARTLATAPGSSPRSNFARLAVDDKRAYWATDSPGAVWFTSLASDHAAPTVIAADPDAGLAAVESATNPYGIAVDATHVYWSDRTAGLIKRRALDSLGTNIGAQVVAVDSKPGDLALDATRVYWVTSDGNVRSRAKDGSGAIATLASGETDAETLVVDDQYVYWARHVIGTAVSRAPKNGSGAQEALATDQKAPWELAQDCTTLYWTNHNNFGTGEVMKVTK